MDSRNMTDTSGFYKTDTGNLLYAAIGVYSPTYTILRATAAQTPVTDGWQWFDDEASARTAYNIPAPVTPFDSFTRMSTP